ncbi:hypothetical protein [Mesobacillus boroniphilus]|uniref:Uncharacterized protein n=1 Tax=Mesobacillus boroniphilus JCM 21738 TaxID=1294265 RepID=W4RHQ7_9BACI|nr:hypothetical protein [Mesobacillus boroniphilus]GAE43423.1 hypothetical protein JCM21738_57 [Mesobacillus boroniphilus JCM 21738]
MMDAEDNEESKGKKISALDEANPYDGLISLYPEEADIETSEIFTYVIPDTQAMVIVPVTVTTPRKKESPG